jgi:hypothetical protein
MKETFVVIIITCFMSILFFTNIPDRAVNSFRDHQFDMLKIGDVYPDTLCVSSYIDRVYPDGDIWYEYKEPGFPFPHRVRICTKNKIVVAVFRDR